MRKRLFTTALLAMVLVLAWSCDDSDDSSANNSSSTNNINNTSANNPGQELCDNGLDDDGDTLVDCDDDDCVDQSVCQVNGVLTVQFSFPSEERARGIYLWIEDSQGNYVDTIQQYFGRVDVPDFDYNFLGRRYPNDAPDQWRAAVSETDELVLDGVTTATPLGPHQSGDYTSEQWDMLDNTGAPIARGIYTVRVEMTFDGDGHPLLPVFHYEGTIDLTGGDATGALTPSDEKVSQATASFTAAQ